MSPQARAIPTGPGDAQKCDDKPQILSSPFPMESFSDRFKEVPTHLVRQVNGDEPETGFRFVGEKVLEGIEAHLSAVCPTTDGKTSVIASCKNILDFGSGLGRIILQLLERAPQAQITGFDIDPLMIKWAKYLFENSKVPFVSSTFGLQDQSYDLITVISVFTHLDHTSEFWLSELHRLLAPDGLAVVTYQDDMLFEKQKRSGILPPTALLEGKYVYGSGFSEGGAMMGTYYTGDYFRRMLEKFFVVHRQITGGLFGHQSVAVVSRRETALDYNQLRFTYAQSLEHELFILKGDEYKLRHNTQRHVTELEEILREQVKLREQLEARVVKLHRRLENTTRDLETFTHLLWKTDDERGSLKTKLSDFQASLAWQLNKPFRNSRTQKRDGLKTAIASETDASRSAQEKFCYYFYDSPFRIYRETNAALRGWCIEKSGLEITAMRVCINGVPFEVPYGLPATDVLLPDGTTLLQCSYGFSAAFAVPETGRHSFELDVKVSDRPWINLLRVPIWSATS